MSHRPLMPWFHALLLVHKKNIKVFIFLVRLYSGVFHPIVFSKKTEKCSHFWLDYIVECSTLSFSANNGKVFVILVKLYRGVFHLIVFQQIMEKCFVYLVKLYSGVFHLIVFSLMVNFSSLWGWEGDWSPTGHVAIFYVWGLVMLPDALLYIMCGNWSHCLMHCLSFADWECRWQLSVCYHQGVHEHSS